MDDEPPDWVSAPPAEARAVTRGVGTPRRPAPTQAQEQAMQQAFFVWLDQPETRHKIMEFLPDYITLATFIQTARTAVQNNPNLLEDRYLPGLMSGVLKAAEMGIPPDGRLGALIPRWDNNTHRMRVVFQPMYHGILMLGRRTGAIKEINTGIVFEGERLVLAAGDDPKLEHYPDPELIEEAYAAMNVRKVEKRVVADVDPFMERVVIAYCVIVGTDGTRHRAWIPRSRLQAIRLGAADGGPWNGPFADEMMKKSAIFLASKMIDLDLANPYTERFRSAVIDGVEQDFLEHESIRQTPALEAPSPIDKLRTMEGMFGLEKEPAFAEQDDTTHLDGEGGDKAEEIPITPPNIERRPSQPGDAPMTAPRRRVDEEAEYLRKQIERLPTVGRVQEYRAKPSLIAWLEKTRQTDPKIAEEIEDAIQDRETFLIAGDAPSA